jgi:hypothetical protein
MKSVLSHNYGATGRHTPITIQYTAAKPASRDARRGAHERRTAARHGAVQSVHRTITQDDNMLLTGLLCDNYYLLDSVSAICGSDSACYL